MSKLKWPRLKRDYTGLTVRTTRELRNGYGIIAVGTVCTVDEWFRGLRLITPPCPHCKHRVFISRVGIDSVELIDTQNNKEL